MSARRAATRNSWLRPWIKNCADIFPRRCSNAGRVDREDSWKIPPGSRNRCRFNFWRLARPGSRIEIETCGRRFASLYYPGHTRRHSRSRHLSTVIYLPPDPPRSRRHRSSSREMKSRGCRHVDAGRPVLSGGNEFSGRFLKIQPPLKVGETRWKSLARRSKDGLSRSRAQRQFGLVASQPRYEVV